MATTTPDGIYYPVSTDQIAPLETVFSTLASSVQTALTARKTLTVANATALDALSEATYSGYLVNVSGTGSMWYSNGTKWILANVPVVASSTARDALYTGSVTPNQGDTVFRNDLGATETYFALYNVSTNPGGRPAAGWFRELTPVGSVRQVVSTTRTTTSSSAAAVGAWADITGMTAAITPTSATSKILVMFDTYIGNSTSGGSFNFVQMLRGSTAIGVGTGGTTNSSGQTYITDTGRLEPITMSFLDSPATTSATTYKLQYQTTAGTIYLNRRGSATDMITASTLTLIEVAA